MRKKRVIVIPDSDAPGEGYKQQVITSLEKRSITHCVVTFDGFKDVSDYLDAGHTGEELARRITDEVSKIDGQGRVTYPETPIYEDISI